MLLKNNFNLFTKVPLSEAEESVLSRGMKFAIAPNKIPKFDILAPVEANISHLSDNAKSQIRVQVSNAIQFSKAPKPNLSKQEMQALRQLRLDKTRVVLQADKGNCTVVMDETDYSEKINLLLGDKNY